MAEDQKGLWPREHYKSNGGKPFLFYVVYGEFPDEAKPSRSRYRFAGLPEGIGVMKYGEDVHPEIRNSFLEGLLWDEFRRENPAVSLEVSRAPQCVILRGEAEHSESLNYLRDVVGFITYLVDNGGVAVYDPQMFRWWGPADWRTIIFETAEAAPRHHVTILVSEEEEIGLQWYHTRGMRKFGRPDISVRRVPRQHGDAVIDLINRFIELQAFGEIIPEGQLVRMASLPNGLTCHHGGDIDDPDFNNVHVEIRWFDVENTEQNDAAGRPNGS